LHVHVDNFKFLGYVSAISFQAFEYNVNIVEWHIIISAVKIDRCHYHRKSFLLVVFLYGM